MKCRNCGHTEVGMYKEIRQVFNEMGIDKQDVKMELSKTIESLIRSTISEQVDSAVERAVTAEIRDMFNPYSVKAKGTELIHRALKEIVGEVIYKQLVIDISLKKE